MLEVCSRCFFAWWLVVPFIVRLGMWYIMAKEGFGFALVALALLTVIGFTSNEPQRYWGVSASRKSPVMCS